MSANDLEIRTCSNSLLDPGRCCISECEAKATTAVLHQSLSEHARCDAHASGPGVIAAKPLNWSKTWGPR